MGLRRVAEGEVSGDLTDFLDRLRDEAGRTGREAKARRLLVRFGETLR